MKNAGLHGSPVRVEDFKARIGLHSARAGVRSAVLADTCLSGDVFDTLGENFLDGHARGNGRTVVVQGDAVEHVVTRHDRVGRLKRLGNTVGIADRLVAVHLDAGHGLLQVDVGGDVDADLGGLVGQQVGDLAVEHGATGHGHGVPCGEVGGDRGGHGRDEADLLTRLDVAVHHQAEARDLGQVGRSVAPRVGGTAGGGVVHGATRGQDLAAAGVGIRGVLDRDVRGRNSRDLGIATRLLLHRLERPRRGVQVRLPVGATGLRGSGADAHVVQVGQDVVGDHIRQGGITGVGDRETVGAVGARVDLGDLTGRNEVGVLVALDFLRDTHRRGRRNVEVRRSVTDVVGGRAVLVHVEGVDRTATDTVVRVAQALILGGRLRAVAGHERHGLVRVVPSRSGR